MEAIEAQLFLQKTIRERLDELKAKNRQFSLRAFARLLSISPASLSEFLNGKRGLSAKMLKNIGEKLCLDPEDLHTLNEKIARDQKCIDHKPKTHKRNIQLQNDQYYLIADWIYYAILCLAETADFNDCSAWIAQRLQTSEQRVDKAIKRLLRLGFLTYDDSGRLSCQDVELSTSEDVPNTSLRKRHMDNLEDAKDSLLNDDILHRDMTFMTLAIDVDKLPEIKKMIRKFQDQIENFAYANKKNEIYELCIQLFPRTQLRQDKKHETLH